MSLTSATAGATEGMVPAHLEILVPESISDEDAIIPLKFNPTQYRLQKQNNFAEIAIPGLESPPLQFVRGGPAKLSLEVLLDTSDTLDDVREAYTDRLRGLLEVDADIHAPPVVRFVWDTQVFRGVLRSADIRYVLFTEKGVPIRAKAKLELSEYRPVEVQVREMRTESPDFDKRYVVRVGDSLASIAAHEYRDGGKWRVIAEHNDIRDPRSLEPGRELAIPKLR